MVFGFNTGKSNALSVAKTNKSTGQTILNILKGLLTKLPIDAQKRLTMIKIYKY
jgi:hypothetical protein